MDLGRLVLVGGIGVLGVVDGDGGLVVELKLG